MTMMNNGREFGRKDGAQPREEKDIQQDLKSTLDQVKKFAEGFDAKAKAGEDVSREAKSSADQALTKLTELRSELTELSQKFAQGRGGDRDEADRKSFGERVAGSTEVKEYAEGGCNGAISLSVKAVTSAAGSGAGLIVNDRQNEIVGIPRRQLRVRSLLTPGRTTSNAIEYPRQVARTNAAATVAEGALKPESNYTWDVATAPVRTVAHWVPVSRQAMDDIPQLESILDGELTYGLDDVEDFQLLLGDGLGQNIGGLYPAATAYAAPSGITVTSPTRDSQLIFANPQGIAGPTLWGRPVVPTKAIGTGNFMVGAFKLAAQIFDRMETEVRISDQDRDNFIRNMLTVRAERRLALAIRRAAAMVKGTLL